MSPSNYQRIVNKSTIVLQFPSRVSAILMRCRVVLMVSARLMRCSILTQLIGDRCHTSVTHCVMLQSVSHTVSCCTLLCIWDKTPGDNLVHWKLDTHWFLNTCQLRNFYLSIYCINLLQLEQVMHCKVWIWWNHRQKSTAVFPVVSLCVVWIWV